MSWIIHFPNQPNHFLQDQTIDFETVVRLARGEINSQLEQMSRIYNQMLRYSSRRANQFKMKFPTISWSDKNVGNRFYYSASNKIHSLDDYTSIISRWRLDTKTYLFVWSEDVEEIPSLYPLGSGTDFNLFYDPDACFLESRYLSDHPSGYSDEMRVLQDYRDKEVIKTDLLRSSLKMKYNWRHDAWKHQLEWMCHDLFQLLESNIEIHQISAINYEITKENQLIGLVYMMEYKMYFTLLNYEEGVRGVFGMSAQELIEIGKLNDIEIVYTNSL